MAIQSFADKDTEKVWRDGYVRREVGPEQVPDHPNRSTSRNAAARSTHAAQWASVTWLLRRAAVVMARSPFGPAHHAARRTAGQGRILVHYI